MVNPPEFQSTTLKPHFISFYLNIVVSRQFSGISLKSAPPHGRANAVVLTEN
jgi:hypothetical protein